MGTYIQNLEMDRPFVVDHISEIHEADTLQDSQFSYHDHTDTFQEQRGYVRSALAGWGMVLGELPYSRDNELTLKCLGELVNFRQKDLAFRGRAREEAAALQFERDKYRSFMEQRQAALDEQTRKLGKVENEIAELKAKTKKADLQIKKEREDDRKMIAMLRQKNEQILHQIKKKEQETNRVKEQMRRSVGEKPQQARNSFEVYEELASRSPRKSDLNEDKYVFLLERNERERNQLAEENAVLKQKLFGVRDLLEELAQWIDEHLFGQKNTQSQTRFFINHHLLFRKDSIIPEFMELIETAKDGLLQLRNLFRNPQRSSESLALTPDKQGFKKKGKQEPAKTERPGGRQQEPEFPREEMKLMRIGTSKRIEIPSENSTPRSMKTIQAPQQKTDPKPNKNQKPEQRKNGTFTMGQGITHSQNLRSGRAQQPIFQDELLSDVSHDSSIVSHIEVEQLGKNRFDKWDILYREEPE